MRAVRVAPVRLLAAAVLVVSGVVASFVVASPPGDPLTIVGQPPDAVVSLDFRSHGDGPVPTRFDTGQSAALVHSPEDPGSAFSMAAGQLTYGPTRAGVAAAYFSTPDLGSPVNGLGARWSLRTRGSASGAIALVVSRATRPTLPLLVEPVTVHLAVEAKGWQLSLQPEAAGVLVPIASGGFAPPLAQDGTSFDTSVVVDGDRITVYLPDGARREIVDPRVRAERSNVATFELFANDGATDSVPAFDYVWAST